MSVATDSTPNITELSITGMTCRNCARHVSEALQGVLGVASVMVSLEDGRARVQWKPEQSPQPQALTAAVRAAGYEAKPLEAELKPKGRLRGWGFNVALGACCAMPLLAGEWLLGLEMERWFQWLGFFLALPVQVICGARFYRGAWNQLKVGSSSMDTLVSLGSTTAFGYSVWVLLRARGEHLFFMEAAVIITLISAGHWLEARMSRRAESSLRALLDLTPQKARRHNPNGSVSETPVASLRVNDVIILGPGDRIPTDGAVVEGQSAVDESMLTGESIPIDKGPGEKLFAGSMNVNGQLVMRVTATGEATALAHIIAAVQRAQNSRADVQRMADRVSNVFVPLVALIALATGLWWGLAPDHARAVTGFLGHHLWSARVGDSTLATAIMCAAAVLIVACPCAMGLATPIAIMAGANAAARRGILIRDGIALERAGRITAIVFDKTGTLTFGKPTVAETRAFAAGHTSESLMPIAAALARPSNHPLSKAVFCLEAELEADRIIRSDALSDWREVRGAGVQAQWNQPEDLPVTARLGSMAWLQESGIDARAGEEFALRWMEQGATILGLAIGDKLAALIALRDMVKPGADRVVKSLQDAGLKTFLITGDNPRTAHAIARQIGISEVFSEIRPEKKAELVKELQERGERVAFVGDGINDAPALEQADLGIAVSHASDVANEAADLILLRSDIQAIPEALDLARATLRTIKQNLFWAFFYNAAAVPLAALGFISPVLCAAAMGLSDLIVVGNALRLRSGIDKTIKREP